MTSDGQGLQVRNNDHEHVRFLAAEENVEPPLIHDSGVDRSSVEENVVIRVLCGYCGNVRTHINEGITGIRFTALRGHSR
jgi:hypothetical protein